ncbi:hypothetical protein EV639_11444 [Rathayibacter tanaceti]|uniref:Uncharacterized protein n=2 Tax=Rathayibacter tanaceti TaxID=1671680 RepID=A0ACD2XGK9_9MICO|nr:hypothetical protein [Rathayibacter tanaceti]QHC56787.1 hypothetical protein GSU10_14890 [Rathayibacter tanaceti]TCO33761.1 hypothetical protein EV639_11444 [Rathayibacter tanaceti]
MTIDLGPTPEQLARMRHAVFTGIALRQRVARRRRLAGLGVAAVVAIGTSAAAIAVTQATNDEANTRFDCYSAPDLRAERITTALADDDRDAFALLPLDARVDAALDTCRASWSAVPDGAVSGGAPIEVENPTVCVLPDSRLGVFPNPEDTDTDLFCEGLGATAPADGGRTD